ncbi:MAG: hypothetical protein GF368_04865 [Candidatus Aenigmarchaeota archaeon]|nr:hypothetical protein [Candidatus Aenigmarchaeota archaeon]
MRNRDSCNLEALKENPQLFDSLRRGGEEVSINIPGYSEHTGTIIYVNEAGVYYLKCGPLLYPLGIWD